jgi:hypothetical protein
VSTAKFLTRFAVAGRANLKKAKKEFQETEEHIKAFQSTGQIVGEVLRPLGNDRCEFECQLETRSTFGIVSVRCSSMLTTSHCSFTCRHCQG